MNAPLSIFPKFYKHLTPDELAGLVGDVGLDTVNLVIRDGFWAAPATLARDVPAFVNTIRRRGLTVHFATAGFSPAQVCDTPDMLRILSDNGITAFRLSHFRAADASSGASRSHDHNATAPLSASPAAPRKISFPSTFPLAHTVSRVL